MSSLIDIHNEKAHQQFQKPWAGLGLRKQAKNITLADNIEYLCITLKKMELIISTTDNY